VGERRVLAGPVVAGVAGVAGAVVGLAVAASRRFDRRGEALVARVGTAVPVAVDPASLPPAVRAWLALALPDGPPGSLPRTVHLDQDIEMAMGPGRWVSGTARHDASCATPAFVWRAAVRVGPVRLVAQDVLVGSVAGMEGRAGGAVPVLRARGPDALEGELLRYLAELPWMPAAVLGNPALRWTALDGHTVEVSVPSMSTTAAVRIGFEDGWPVWSRSPTRARTVGRLTVPTPWGGTFSEPRRFGDVVVPSRAEVAWRIDGEWQPYWRCTVTSVQNAG
jgi:hypothetical protein